MSNPLAKERLEGIVRKRHGETQAKDRSELNAGDMIIYPFLWHWQHEKGLERAEKMRPCMVLMRIEGEDPTLVILPITSKRASLKHDRLFVPPEECDRIGMKVDKMASIGLNDFNFDVISTSTCLRRNVPIRQFSKSFTERVGQEFRRVYEAQRANSVTRVPDPENEYSF